MKKIIQLWVHPRSLSTAMERVFIERGDFTVFHEPFAYTYYLEDGVTDCANFHIDESKPRKYEDVRQALLDAAEEKPVFSKDMSYHAALHLKADQAFFQRCINTFMIREPRKTILSHYRCSPNLTLDEVGYLRRWELVRLAADYNGNVPPVIIDADDLENDPVGIVKAYCQAVGIEFLADAMNWEADKEVPEWNQWAEWHVDATRSCGIQKNMETFDFELDDIKSPNLRSYYEFSLPLYEAMYKLRLQPIK